jgi:hypothetical protein
MLTWAEALLKRFTPEPEFEVQERIIGRVVIDDEGQLPAARKELIKRSFEAAGREPDDDFIYDFAYDEVANQFELAVIINVDGGGSGDQETS